MENKKQEECDEIDLSKYLVRAYKRKWVVLGVFILVAGSAAAYNFSLPPHYRIDSVLKIGEINGKPAEAPRGVKEKVHSGFYGISASNRLGTSLDFFPEVRIVLLGKDIIRMQIVTPDATSGKAFLWEINSFILEEHDKLFRERKKLHEMEIEAIETALRLKEAVIDEITNKIVILEKLKENSERKIRNLKNQAENLKVSIQLEGESGGNGLAISKDKERLIELKGGMADLYAEIHALDLEISDLRVEILSQKLSKADYDYKLNSLMILSSKLSPTKIMKEPEVSGGPNRPEKVKNIFVAAFFGLFAGIFIALGIDWRQEHCKK